MSGIVFCGADFTLRPSGAMFWAEEGILVASDLHLEKGSSFSLRGFFLPPYDTRETLSQLAADMEETGARRLILLGDSFHDEKGYRRMNEDDRAFFEKIIRRQETIWIAGNHDRGYVPEGIAAMDEYVRRGIHFRHEAGESAQAEVSGHYHPAASFRHKGHKIGGRCFAVTQTRLIMPSFGSYTGGLDIFTPVLAGFLGDDFTVHICARSRLYAIRAADFQK